MANNDMNHLKFLKQVAERDVEHLLFKEATYKGSWKKRGGVGAWMMACRKFDRLENILESRNWDVFKAIAGEHAANILEGADGTVLAEIRDLRRYLLLIEAEMVARQNIPECNEPLWITT